MRKGGCAALVGAIIVAVLAGCAAPTPTVSATGVSLDKNGIGLVIGESKTLTATVLPASASNKGVSWNSDDITVATVDKNGVVTGVGAGWTTITVTTDDGGFKASAGVVVSTLPVSGIKLEPATLELKVGDSYQLTWTVLPDFATDKKVTWTSSDSTVVLPINNEPGKIFALKAGTATITVTTHYGSFTDTCIVTVK